MRASTPHQRLHVAQRGKADKPSLALAREVP